MTKTYTQTEQQHADGLRLIDDVAGPVPSEISNALATLEPFVQSPPEAKAAWTQILQSNLKLGTSPGEETTKPGVILQLRNMLTSMTEIDEAPPELPPVTGYGEWPATFPPGNEATPWASTPPNSVRSIQATRAGNASGGIHQCAGLGLRRTSGPAAPNTDVFARRTSAAYGDPSRRSEIDPIIVNVR